MAVCVGCGLTVNGSGVLIVDRNPDSSLSGIDCTDAAGLSLHANTVNSTSISITGIGTDTSKLSAAIIRSPDNCNGVDLRGNGLYVPCPKSIVGAVNTGFTGFTAPFSPMVAGGTYDAQSVCPGSPAPTATTYDCVGSQIHICNPLCCSAQGLWDVTCYGGLILGAPGFDATAFLMTSIDGGAFGAASPTTKIKMTNQGPASQFFELGNFQENNFIAFDAVDGAVPCHRFSAQFRIEVAGGSTGNGTWVTGPQFEFRWHFHQTGCCS